MIELTARDVARCRRHCIEKFYAEPAGQMGGYPCDLDSFIRYYVNLEQTITSMYRVVPKKVPYSKEQATQFFLTLNGNYKERCCCVADVITYCDPTESVVAQMQGIEPRIKDLFFKYGCDSDIANYLWTEIMTIVKLRCLKDKK